MGTVTWVATSTGGGGGRRAPAAGTLLAFLMGCPAVVGAYEWEISPRVRVEETYTDNVALNPPGQEEEELVTELAPGIDIHGEGRRSELDLSYTLQTLFYAEDSDRNDAFHRFDGFGHAELVERRLFVDAEARRRQAATSLLGPLSSSNVNVTDNRTDITTLRVEPYLINRLDNVALSRLSHSHGRVYYGDDRDDARVDETAWRLSDGPAFANTLWRVEASHREVEASENTSGTFRQFLGTLGYRLTPAWTVSGAVGYEDNDYNTERDDIDDPVWYVGVRWTPTRRTSAEARYGERYFGETVFLALEHRRRFTVWSLDYTEDIASNELVFLRPTNRVPVFADDCPAAQPGCEPIDERVVFEEDAVNQFFIDERLRGRVILQSPRQALTFVVYRVNRTLELNRSDERYQTGASVGWDWRLGPFTAFTADADVARHEFDLSGREDDLWRARVGLRRDFGRHVDGYIRFGRRERSSTEAAAEYRENTVVVGLVGRF
ncbi:TIGR03016 family PEP-CTERM system-associated outer membrane protein [Arhodomonas sp. SL1]|uniref:TIGR03016 family PEP-CTERM system-associated outer membrane protein n=1 Tax=Arhodomonas sp. SL1 TaxID=3425691 RepID=UPI003F885119